MKIAKKALERFGFVTFGCARPNLTTLLLVFRFQMFLSLSLSVLIPPTRWMTFSDCCKLSLSFMILFFFQYASLTLSLAFSYSFCNSQAFCVALCLCLSLIVSINHKHCISFFVLCLSFSHSLVSHSFLFIYHDFSFCSSHYLAFFCPFLNPSILFILLVSHLCILSCLFLLLFSHELNPAPDFLSCLEILNALWVFSIFSIAFCSSFSLSISFPVILSTVISAPREDDDARAAHDIAKQRSHRFFGLLQIVDYTGRSQFI